MLGEFEESLKAHTKRGSTSNAQNVATLITWPLQSSTDKTPQPQMKSKATEIIILWVSIVAVFAFVIVGYNKGVPPVILAGVFIALGLREKSDTGKERHRKIIPV
jgi:hypothetical protein